MAESFNTNLKDVAGNYMRRLKAKVTNSTLTELLEQNPNYPSLLSLSDTFDKFDIDNQGFRISKEEFVQLEPPFIAFMANQPNGKDFVLVTDIHPESVSYLSDGTKPKNAGLEKFKQDYQGIVWHAEPNALSGESDYELQLLKESKSKREKILLASGLGILIIAAVFTNVSGLTQTGLISFLLLLILKLTGLATAVLLLLYEMDKSGAFVKNICTAGAKTNCEAVLDSKSAKIFGVGWSEIGFFYFAASFLWLLSIVDFPTKIVWLAIGNAAAVPYILFSVYYQWKVVKQWCPLCLTIQIILAGELFWSFFYFWNAPVLPVLNVTLLSVIVLSVLAPILVWYFIKPFFIQAKDGKIYKAAYKRTQYNPEIFNSLLKQQAAAPPGYENLGIDIGNPNAKNTILKICNPYCGPCAKAHPKLQELLRLNKDVNVKIMFSSNNGVGDKGAPVIKHFLALNNEKDADKTYKALDEWYGAKYKDYALFADKYKLSQPLLEFDKQVEAMGKWCKEADVQYTPTYFINGFRIPENYTIEELKWIL